jgi:hypothetical protein
LQDLEQSTKQFQGKFSAAAKDDSGNEKCSMNGEIVNGAFKGTIVREACTGVVHARYQITDNQGDTVKEGEIDGNDFYQLDTWLIQVEWRD